MSISFSYAWIPSLVREPAGPISACNFDTGLEDLDSRPNTTSGSDLPRSPEWEELRAELEAIAAACSSFNAYILDVWDNSWCAARGFNDMPRADLADFIHAAASRKAVTLTRGGKLDTSLSGPMGHAFLRTYGSCYVLLLRFSRPFDVEKTRDTVRAALPRLEALTMRLPPPDGPGSDGNEAAGTA
jgi:hypothetical protein